MTEILWADKHRIVFRAPADTPGLDAGVELIRRLQAERPGAVFVLGIQHIKSDIGELPQALVILEIQGVGSDKELPIERARYGTEWEHDMQRWTTGWWYRYAAAPRECVYVEADA